MLTNQLRIIAGRWRGRQIRFPSIPDLRPTSDRLRETLFNWLKPYLTEANCLDVFSGSGALGFEAASRGVKKVLLLEQSPLAVKQLQANKESLAAENIEIHQVDAIKFLSATQQQFNIIFIDPPFSSGYAEQSLAIVVNKNLLAVKGVLYLEQPKKKIIDLQNWQIIKEKTMGQVTARLLAW